MCEENKRNRKIMVLGGNIAQVPLITTAQEEGLFVVLCDYTTTNPGVCLADKHYQQNFMDQDKVLQIARAENIGGIISNSEPAMPVVAYVSEKMGLVGNPVSAVQNLMSKESFRELQHKVGVFAPKHSVTFCFREALEKAEELTFPIIIKPCVSSGSRGTAKIESREALAESEKIWNECSRFSFNGSVVLEEYIEMSSLDAVIDGDIFVMGDTILWDGLFSSKRSPFAPMLPMTQTYPIDLPDTDLEEVKRTLSALLKAAGFCFGELNIEMFYGRAHNLFCIEMNVRQGGNGIPKMIEKHCGINMYRLLVTSAMGDLRYLNSLKTQIRKYRFVSRHPVFSHVDGEYEGLFFSPEILPFVVGAEACAKRGQHVNAGRTSKDALAMVDLEFDTREHQLKYVDRIEDHIKPVVKECGDAF